MKTVYYCSALLLTALLFGSCTIEKRLHQPGWHVEWRKQLPAREVETAAGDFQPTSDLTVTTGVRTLQYPAPQEDENAGSIIVPEQAPAEVAETITDTKPAEMIENRTVFAPPADDTLKRKVVVIDESEYRKSTAEKDLGQRDPLTIALWALSALSIVLISLTILLILVFSPSSALLLAFLFAEFPFLIALRGILAALIRSRERNYPDRYLHSENTLLAVFLPELYLIFAFVVMILVAIALL